MSESVQWTVTTGAGIIAGFIARKQRVRVPGDGWLWLGSIVRGVELAVLWGVVVLLRGW